MEYQVMIRIARSLAGIPVAILLAGALNLGILPAASAAEPAQAQPTKLLAVPAAQGVAKPASPVMSNAPGGLGTSDPTPGNIRSGPPSSESSGNAKQPGAGRGN